MDVAILRTLAWKSILGFGKYKFLSVQQIFDLGHTAYLRYIYYNVEGISFNTEILTKIHVINNNYDNRIEKPGTNPELCKKMNHIMFNLMCDRMNANHAKNKVTFGSKKKIFETINYEKRHYSKQSMQRRNQGK
jgi:hypothetical protein